jgi:hypothetical protein
MWHRIEVVLTEVSEKRTVSIFRVEGNMRKVAREASVRDVKGSLPLLYGATSQKTAFFKYKSGLYSHFNYNLITETVFIFWKMVWMNPHSFTSPRVEN